jgi:hypothetical protein
MSYDDSSHYNNGLGGYNYDSGLGGYDRGLGGWLSSRGATAARSDLTALEDSADEGAASSSSSAAAAAAAAAAARAAAYDEVTSTLSRPLAAASQVGLRLTALLRAAKTPRRDQRAVSLEAVWAARIVDVAAMAEARAVLNAKLATARSAVAVDPMRRSKGEANGRSSGAHHSARQAQIMQLPSTSHGRCDGRGHCCGDGAGSVAAVPPTAHAAAAFSKGVVPPPPPTTTHADTAAAFATAAAIAAGAEGMGTELGAEMAARRALFTQHMQRVLARGS